MSWISIIGSIIATIIKAIFGTDKPRVHTVEHAKPEANINDGKTDADRLRDLGL